MTRGSVYKTEKLAHIPVRAQQLWRLLQHGYVHKETNRDVKQRIRSEGINASSDVVKGEVSGAHAQGAMYTRTKKWKKEFYVLMVLK